MATCLRSNVVIGVPHSHLKEPVGTPQQQLCPLAKPSLEHLTADPQLIEIIRPPLRHSYALSPVCAAMVCGSDLIPFAMG